MGSLEFRQGCHRLIKHEQLQQRKQSPLPVNILDRIAGLADLELIGVASLRSSFRLCTTGEDVTAQAAGSSTVLESVEDPSIQTSIVRHRLYMLIPGMRPHQLTTNLTIVISRLLGGSILNLQPLSCMLTCQPQVRDFHAPFFKFSFPTRVFLCVYFVLFDDSNPCVSAHRRLRLS